jgi:hypothetical protein
VVRAGGSARVVGAARLALAPVAVWAALALTGCSGEEAGGQPGSALPRPVATEAATTTTAVPDEGGRVDTAYVPRLGECFDERSSTDAGTGRETAYRLVVDCLLPHEHEVFALVPAGDGGAPYPGEDPLRRIARLECPRAFPGYVGAAYELSVYGLGFVLPTPPQWSTGAVIGCTLTAPGGGRTAGSARDSAR